MKHVKPRNKFVNEEFEWKNPIKYLLDKLKKSIPQNFIDKFIENNREHVQQVAIMLATPDGELDYAKAKTFIRENIKAKKVNEGMDRNSLNQTLYMVHDLDFYQKSGYMDFLESLNLSHDQYVKLADIISDYGEKRYGDGYDDGCHSSDPYYEKY